MTAPILLVQKDQFYLNYWLEYRSEQYQILFKCLCGSHRLDHTHLQEWKRIKDY